MNSKKAISPVIAIVLLLIVSVITVVAFQGWFNTYSSDIFSNVETKSNSAIDSNLKIDNLIGNTLYVINNIEDNLSLKEVKIDNINCIINKNLTIGLNKLNVTDCINNITDNTPDIVLVSENNIVQKKVFIRDVKDIQSGSGSLSSENQTLILQPNEINSKDTFVVYSDDNYNSNTNYGNWKNLSIRYYSSSYNLESFLWFNLSQIPVNSEINNATLTLYFYKNTGIPSSNWDNQYAGIGRITSQWDENTVTGNTAPSRNYSTYYDNQYLPSEDWKFYHWNITDLVQNWVNGTWENYGMFLKITTSGEWGYGYFNSSNCSNSNYRPKLTINYN